MDLYIDAGFASRAEAEAAGVLIGTPIVYRPQVVDLRNAHCRNSVDDRAGCAVIVEVARALAAKKRPTVHIRVFRPGGNSTCAAH